WPTVSVTIRPKGLMGADAMSYPIFSIFDALFQLADPDNLGYDESLFPDTTLSQEDKDSRRDEIVRRALALVRQFIQPEHRENISSFFTASLVKYSLVPNPVREVMSKRLAGT